MAIVVAESMKLSRRDQSLAHIIAMIEEAATSKEDVSPFKLGTMILEHVEKGMKLARQDAELSAEDEVVGEIEGYAKNADEWDVLATSGNILAVVRQAFDQKWGSR